MISRGTLVPPVKKMVGWRSATTSRANYADANLRGDDDGYERLAVLFKQINAPVGELGLRTLQQATTAIKGSDTAYNAWLAFIATLASQRDALVAEIKTTLNDVIFGDRKLGEHRVESLVRRAETLLGDRVDEDDD